MSAHKYRIHLYKAKDGWRWRAVARNGRIVAEGGEAYRSRKTMLRSVTNLMGDPHFYWQVRKLSQEAGND